MAKAEKSKRPKKSSKKSKTIVLTEQSASDFNFNEPEMVRKILAKCLLTGDMNTFEDVFLAFIKSQSKVKLAAKSKLGRQTLYDLLDENRKFNPEWETLRSILKVI